ncbi:MAG TPA: lactonase family protein [Polyangia bacterium]|nr:lactonase family protein [Polyangia bacterium]
MGACQGGGGTGGRAGAGGGGAAPSSGSGGGPGGGASGTGGTLDAGSSPDSSSGGSTTEAGALDVGAGGGDATAGSDGGGGGGGPARSFVYVSGYGEPITIFTLNTATGALTRAGTASTSADGEPTSMGFSPDKKVLYAGDEQHYAPMGRVIAYAINHTTGALQEINREGTRATITAHTSVHRSGKWLLAANYGSGDVTVFPLRADGGLGPAMTPVPAGGQAHYILFDSTGTFLFVPCLASNYIAMYRFADGVLTPNTPPTVPVPGGPRHIAFSPDERFAYVLTQLQSTVVVLAHDKPNGRLTVLETVTSAPNGSISAHIAVHPTGKFVYASNRLDNSISIFSVDTATGRLTRVGQQRDRIAFPWWFDLDPAGQLLIVPNDPTGTVLVHRIDQNTGTLQPLGMPVSVPMRPTYVGILSLP